MHVVTLHLDNEQNWDMSFQVERCCEYRDSSLRRCRQCFFSDVFALSVSSSLAALDRLSKMGCTCGYGADGGWL